MLVGDDAAAVGVGEDEVVEARQEAHGSGSVARRQWRTRQVEELAAALVAEAPQRLERLERRLEVAYAKAAPRGDVRTGRRPERAEIAADERDPCRQRGPRRLQASRRAARNRCRG